MTVVWQFGLAAVVRRIVKLRQLAAVGVAGQAPAVASRLVKLMLLGSAARMSWVMVRRAS